MSPVVFPMSASARKGRHGMALILTLAILALLSILLVSFVSMAALDRGSTKSYAQSLRADQIALGGLDQIVSQVQAEIADPLLSTNAVSIIGSTTNNLYIPLANTNAVPQRTAPFAANLATLLSYSGTNLYTTGSGTPDNSSASLTQTTSLNGRYISTARWDKPLLTTSTNGFPDPKWVLMTRAGPQALTAYNNNVADASALNTNFVVGRYAYVIYDTSGLLDANVAGYPSTASANAPTKGLIPWADLTQLDPATITTSVVDQLVNWRNAASAATYATSVYTTATNNGFTVVAPNGDTCFLSRQELIKYAQTQNTPLTNALPYLTTFSRELNGPTWGPSTPSGSLTNYAAQEYSPGSYNPRIPNPRVQSPGFTRNNGLPAVPGDPLVKYRFPLDKLALLEKFTGTGNGTLTSADIANIQKYFGLDLAPDANGPSYRHWIYPTASTTYVHGVLSGANGIMTLDDVAQQNREPDFFELLQAGMLSGSLGVPGFNAVGPNAGRGDEYPANGNGSTLFVDPDDKTTLQVLRIGANIIDQSDADSFPTTITYSPAGGNPTSVYGIEDLPYPFAAFLNTYAPTPNTPPFNFYLYFELWNPHQTPSSISSANYPQNFQLSPLYTGKTQTASDSFLPEFAGKPASGAKGYWAYNGSTNIFGKPQYLGDPAAPQAIVFPAATTAYREPALIPSSSATLTGITNNAPAPINSIAYFAPTPLYSFPPLNTPGNNPGPSTPFPANPSTAVSQWQVETVMYLAMRLQYQDAGNNWRTYATFMGIDDTGGAYPLGTGYLLNGFLTPTSTPSLNALSFVKSDPRTFRLGAGENGLSSTSNANQPLSASNGTMNNPVNSVPPFGTTNSPGVSNLPNTPYRIDMWAANDSSVTVPTPHSTITAYAPYYSDTDGVQRSGDARNSYKLSTPTSPLFTGATANRPVMLNRPFQSVGELGYAFRDMPWKTLDLSSANSADSGLLDLFTISDAPVVDGRVNPNTPYPQVLAALISGATQGTTSGTTVSGANALAVGEAIQSETATTPFLSRADLVNNFMANSVVTSTFSPSGIKTEEEAAVRAVAESANTRTWTFLIDIIAQSGRYPTTAGSLDNFVVEGERRYWLHISIDRYTGQIVDKQLELVNE